MKKIACVIVVALTSGCYGAAAQQPTTTAAMSTTNVAYVQGVGPGYMPSAGSGLNLNLAAGTAFCANIIQNYAGGTLILTASATNFVYLDTAASCAPAANTTGFTASLIPIATVVTSSSAISAVTDVRTWFVAPSPATPAAGGAATPAGSSTQFQYNSAGAFSGTSNLTYASGTGAVNLNQLANGNETLYGTRTTDTSSAGNLIHFQNSAKTLDLFKLDTSGNVTATSFTSTASGPFVISGTEGACSGAAAGKDVLCLGDTGTHTARLALNGRAFVPIPQLAGDLGGTAAAPQVISTHVSHLNQAGANSALAGTITLSAATSAVKTFGSKFNSAPVCTLTPTKDPGSGTRYWVTATTTQVTANVSSAMTIKFNYHCIGNPN